VIRQEELKIRKNKIIQLLNGEVSEEEEAEDLLNRNSSDYLSYGGETEMNSKIGKLSKLEERGEKVPERYKESPLLTAGNEKVPRHSF